MFKIVQDEQGGGAPQCVGQSGYERLGAGRLNVKYPSDRRHHMIGIHGRREIQKVDTAGEFRLQAVGHLECEACLSDTAGTRQGHQPVSRMDQQVADYPHLRRSANQLRRRYRKRTDSRVGSRLGFANGVVTPSRDRDKPLAFPPTEFEAFN